MKQRQGFALSLPLTVGLLVLLALVAFAQVMRSGQTLEEAAWDAGGAACEEAATSAIEEAVWRLQRAMTDPSDALYWHLRRELVRGARPYLDLSSDLDPKHLRDRLNDRALPPLFRHMKIERFRAVLHVPTSTQSHPQLADFDCGVSLDLAEHRVYRRACERRRYGVVHVSPPKPFDQLTVAIADHGFLHELPRLLSRRANRLLAANALAERLEWIRKAVSGGAGPRLTGRATRAGDAVNLAFAPPFLPAKRAPRLPGFLLTALADRLRDRRRQDPGAESARARMTPDERAWDDWRMVLDLPAAWVKLRAQAGQLPAASAVWPRLPGLVAVTAAPPSDAVVFSQAAEVDLAEFDYEVRLRDKELELADRLDGAMEQVNALWADLIQPEPVEMPVDRLLGVEQVLAQQFAALKPPLTELTHFLDELIVDASRHTRTGFTTGALQAYLRRASHRLRAFGLHVEDQADLKEVLADYPVFNGHLSLSGRSPMELDWPQFSGKAVISVRAERGVAEPLALKALHRARADADLAVVDAPVVQLNGEPVDAAIVAGQRLVLRDQAAITGSLLMARLGPLKDRGRDEELKGRVTYDPLVSSGLLLERRTKADEPDGFALDHLVITMCPRGAQRVVRRVPPAEEDR